MLELLNIRFSFLCRTTHCNSHGKHPLVFRVIYRGERRDIFTGLYCEKKEWNAKTHRLDRLNKSYTAINENLDLIERKGYEVFEAFRNRDREFTLDELMDKLQGKGDRPTLLIDYLEEGKEGLKKRLGVDITPATYDKYRRSASHVQKFLLTEYKVKNYALSRIDSDFLEKYFQYLRGTRGIGHNTSVKYITFFKTILMPALRASFIPGDPFRQIKHRIKTVTKSFLSQQELTLLEAATLSPDLDRIRDIFLFSCYTGLAYIDVKQFCRAHIFKDNDDTYYIRKPRQKTGQECLIPLLPAAMRILQKHSLTTAFSDFTWYVSSNQKINKRLKVIGEQAGIKQLPHFHLARHTFATTVTLTNGIPIETVSSMLGHSTIGQTQHYAKIVGTKVKSDMAKIKGIFM